MSCGLARSSYHNLVRQLLKHRGHTRPEALPVLGAIRALRRFELLVASMRRALSNLDLAPRAWLLARRTWPARAGRGADELAGVNKLTFRTQPFFKVAK